MKKIKYRPILVVLLMGWSLLVKAQNMPAFPPEKFEISTDRDWYMVGENIWFSATDLLSDEKSIQSRVLYAELFDRTGKAILRQKIELKSGFSDGCFRIPEQLSSDYYFLRVYTAVLRNYPASDFPTKRITIINPDLPFLAPETEISSQTQIILPSEGLVNGSKNQGFIILPKAGKNPSSVSILNSLNDTLSQALKIADGIFSFEVFPEESSAYFVLIDDKDVDPIRLSIPHSKSGFLFTNEQINHQLKLSLKSNAKAFEKLKNQNLRFELFDANKRLISYDNQLCNDKNQDFLVDIHSLSKGIYYLRILNDKGEKLWFSLLQLKDSSEKIVNITLNKEVYQQGEEVKLQINPIDTNSGLRYTVSVVKRGTYKSEQEIFKEIIRNPEMADFEHLQQLNKYLFEAAALCFIQTNKEKLKNSLSNIVPIFPQKFYAETRALNISGRLVDKESQEIIKNEPVIMSHLDMFTRVHLGNTDNNGEFSFPIYHQYGSKDLFLSPLDSGNRALIQIHTDFCTEFPDIPPVYPSLDTTEQKLLEELWLNQQLAGLTMSELNISTPPNYDSVFGFSQPEIKVKLDDYIDLPDMETVFSEIVPFVAPRKRKGNYYLLVYDEITGSKYQQPLVLVDNIPLIDMNKLMEIKPAQVSEIQVINRVYYLGDHYFRGVILIKSKTGSFAGIPMPEDAVFLKYQMLQPPIQFLSADPLQASFRNVLYWAPFSHSKEKSDHRFYTSQHLSEYDVIVKGFTKEGLFFEERKSFSVEK